MTDAFAAHLNGLSPPDAIEELRKLCGAAWWCERVASGRPLADRAAAEQAVETAFDEMPDAAWLEALNAHPRIGDLESLRMRFAGNKQWSAGEQSGVDGAGDDVLHALKRGNEEYADRFGYTFVVCATGKTAAQMLAILRERLANPPDEELRAAAAEQRKITRLRLAKLADAVASNPASPPATAPPAEPPP